MKDAEDDMMREGRLDWRLLSLCCVVGLGPRRCVSIYRLLVTVGLIASDARSNHWTRSITRQPTEMRYTSAQMESRKARIGQAVDTLRRSKVV
jgi:hypothetical protein